MEISEASDRRLTYGWGKVRPRFLQVVNNPKCFLFFLVVFSITQGACTFQKLFYFHWSVLILYGIVKFLCKMPKSLAYVLFLGLLWIKTRVNSVNLKYLSFVNDSSLFLRKVC